MQMTVWEAAGSSSAALLTANNTKLSNDTFYNRIFGVPLLCGYCSRTSIFTMCLGSASGPFDDVGSNILLSVSFHPFLSPLFFFFPFPPVYIIVVGSGSDAGTVVGSSCVLVGHWRVCYTAKTSTDTKGDFTAGEWEEINYSDTFNNIIYTGTSVAPPVHHRSVPERRSTHTHTHTHTRARARAH